MIVLAGCGGGDGSKDSTTSKRSIGSTQAGSATRGARDTPKRKIGAPKAATPKKGGIRTPGRSNQVFEQARKACATSGVNGIAHTFQIRSRAPADVAREYARKAYPRPVRPAASRGCLSGLNK